ncbi:sirohydrochlorin ferrochelatase, chloroplastic-like isoform X2 [Ziziphus jujuba]|uniref:Sirohydrochlorin ferrochelatase, chloroplastic-like isoform X2 n=1 Tax=Ziziphus jujuba TaxID=326968 RepID=A0ABM3IIS2_ZIZJJ|nr:sirohydrochlorin ferrochelatase, chloroplastic-like isoform X2 [Ziziphus jujuba]
MIVGGDSSKARSLSRRLHLRDTNGFLQNPHEEPVEPSIRDSFDACVQQGTNRVFDVVNDRIKYCISHVAGDANECSVCAGTSKCRLY